MSAGSDVTSGFDLRICNYESCRLSEVTKIPLTTTLRDCIHLAVRLRMASIVLARILRMSFGHPNPVNNHLSGHPNIFENDL